MTQIPLFEPSSDWTPPKDFPNLSGERLLAIDTETKDPFLLDKGPGFLRGDAETVGVSIATPHDAWYFPMKHAGGGNLDFDNTLSWLTDTLSEPDRPIVFFNAMYDIEALWDLDIEVAGPWYDVQGLQALLDEEYTGGYSLDNIASRELGRHKDETQLIEAAAAYGYQKQPKAGLWALHSKHVGPYAETDARLTLDLFHKQISDIHLNGMDELWEIETDLLKVIWQMRLRGVKVDLERANKLRQAWKKEVQDIVMEVQKDSGMRVELWSSKKSLAPLAQKYGVKVPRTKPSKNFPDGQPSVTNDWLQSQTHPMLQKVARARRIDKMRRDFIDGLIFGHEIDGRLHAQFHPLRRDDAGTRSGRFSSTNPNLQQVPTRDPEFGALVRTIFIPETGHDWLKADYKAQEPRLTVHFAHELRTPGTSQFVEAWLADPKMNIYTYIQEQAGCSYRAAKDIFLGMCYGMGRDKLAIQLGMNPVEAEDVFFKFHRSVPFVAKLAQTAMNIATKRGYVKTILKRRRHFKDFFHKALNAVIQGSGADMTKKAMVDLYLEHDIVPLITVHDELDFSSPHKEYQDTIQETMENVLELHVPIIAEMEIGPNWGELKEAA